MNPQVERSLSRIADEARDRYNTLMDNARSRTEKAAGRVRKGKKPVQTLSKLGVNLSKVSHSTTAKVLKQQGKMVEHQIDALATRLRTAAQAGSLRELLRDQVRLIPVNTSQFVTDTRASLSIVASAGGDVRELLAGTAAELRGKTSVPARSRTRTAKKAKSSAKPVAKAATKAPKRRTARAKAA